MRRVILGEFKKVFKSKINIALLVLLFVFSGFLNYNTYHNSALSSSYLPKVKENGAILDSLSLYQKLDEDLEKKAGVISSKTYEMYYQEYVDKMKETFHNDAYDMQRAKEMYGEYAKEVIEKTENKSVTNEDIERFCQLQCSYAYDENDNIIFEIPYKNDGKRFYLNVLYFNYNGTELLNESDWKKSINNPFYVLTHSQEFMYTNENSTSPLFWMNPDSSDDTKQIATYLSEKMKDNEYEFHSTVANNLFLENLQSTVNVFALIVIAILIANIFASEASLKTDQIIVPTKMGNVKLTGAKIICALTIGIGVLLVLWLLAFLSAMLCLPIHDLNTVVMNLGGTYSSAINYVFTYQEVILNGLLITVLSVIFTVLITLGLSYFTKNRFATIIPVFLFLLLPLIIPFYYLFKIALLDYLMPAKAMSFINYFTFDSTTAVAYVMIKDTIIPAIYIAAALFVIISIVVTVIMFIHSRKHIVSNR